MRRRIEHVLPFGIRLEVETCLKLDVLACVAAQIYLLDDIIDAEEQVAKILISINNSFLTMC